MLNASRQAVYLASQPEPFLHNLRKDPAMSFEKIKAVARQFGMYRTARWLHLHTMSREQLGDFRREVIFYSHIVPPGSLCFDVGANYGSKSQVFLKLGAIVVAFEPQRDCMDELKARIGTRADLVPVNAAVGSTPGHRTLFIESYRPASSLLKDWQGEVIGSIEVPVTTLDHAIAEFGVPRYCKIDVEGYELEVLEGLSHPIPVVSFEYHLRRDGVSQALACLDHLAQFGHIFVNITPAEKPIFARSEWWEKSDFVRFFQQSVPGMPGYDYGDIFVKLAS